MEGYKKFAVSKVLSLVKLSGLMGDVDFNVASTTTEAHYGTESSPQEIVFFAQAIPEPLTEDPRLKSLFDCMNAFGFPAPDDPGAMLKEWKVQWTPGTDPHALLDLDKNQFDFPGSWTARLDESGMHWVTMDMANEDPEAHGEGARQRSGRMWMEAKLDTSSPPFAALIKVLIGDLPDAMFDLATGFYQSVGGPRKQVVMRAIWHEPSDGEEEWVGTITYVTSWSDSSGESRPATVAPEEVEISSTASGTQTVTITIGGTRVGWQAQHQAESSDEKIGAGRAGCYSPTGNLLAGAPPDSTTNWAWFDRFQSSEVASGSGELDGDAPVVGSGGSLQVGISRRDVSASGTERRTFSSGGTGYTFSAFCDRATAPFPAVNDTTTSPFSPDFELPGVDIPDDGSETLSGSQTVSSPYGQGGTRTTTVTWSLTRR